MKLDDLVRELGGELMGDNGVTVTSVGSMDSATPSQITFLSNPRYRSRLADSKAGAVILSDVDRDATTRPRIVTKNPYAYYAKVAQKFSPPREYLQGVHANAVVHPDAKVAASASIAEFVSIAAGVIIHEGVRIGPGCHIAEAAEIGAGTRLAARVTVSERCRIGARCIIHSGVVIGADGFGFAPEFTATGGGWVKIPQTGCVVIGDDVEIGANTTIDRGALDDTIIGNGVKLDNQIQIGHNVVIGDHTAMAGCVGIAGSARIGSHCMVGGGAIILGHLDVADRCTISAMTLITKSITEPDTYTSVMPFMKHAEWLKNAAQLRRLDQFVSAVKKINQGEKS